MDPLALPRTSAPSRGRSDPQPPCSPEVVVHGDFRNGNLIVGPEGIRAVLDWS